MATQLEENWQQAVASISCAALSDLKQPFKLHLYLLNTIRKAQRAVQNSVHVHKCFVQLIMGCNLIVFCVLTGHSLLLSSVLTAPSAAERFENSMSRAANQIQVLPPSHAPYHNNGRLCELDLFYRSGHGGGVKYMYIPRISRK